MRKLSGSLSGSAGQTTKASHSVHTAVARLSGRAGVPVVLRERNGNTLPGVFNSEVEALNFIRRQVLRGTELYADEASAWNALHARYTLHRINHEEAYSLGGEFEINTNSAESFFARLGRGEVGHHHHVAGPYLIRFAQEGKRCGDCTF